MKSGTQKIFRCPVHVYKGPGTYQNFPGVKCRQTPCTFHPYFGQFYVNFQTIFPLLPFLFHPLNNNKKNLYISIQFPFHTKSIQYFLPISLPHQKYSIHSNFFPKNETKISCPLPSKLISKLEDQHACFFLLRVENVTNGQTDRKKGTDRL